MKVYILILSENHYICDIIGLFLNECVAEEEAEKIKRLGYNDEVFPKILEMHLNDNLNDIIDTMNKIIINQEEMIKSQESVIKKQEEYMNELFNIIKTCTLSAPIPQESYNVFKNILNDNI